MVRKYVAEFIKYQYKRSDMSMNEPVSYTHRDENQPLCAFGISLSPVSSLLPSSVVSHIRETDYYSCLLYTSLKPSRIGVGYGDVEGYRHRECKMCIRDRARALQAIPPLAIPHRAAVHHKAAVPT